MVLVVRGEGGDDGDRVCDEGEGITASRISESGERRYKVREIEWVLDYEGKGRLSALLFCGCNFLCRSAVI